ncbi:MAG TPA: ATP-binding protein [Candidatus Nitrosotalea sp.]|nr:ATP-binding protein [Candidatus Nitrosotalea sp.]
MSRQPKGTDKNATLIGDLSSITDRAFRELAATKAELQAKEKLLNQMALGSSEKMRDLSEINRDLQEKVGFLLDLSVALNKKNDELAKSNRDLEAQKYYYDQITADLADKLEKVVAKEKELSVQRDLLAKEVDEKTQDLITSAKFSVIGELAARLAHDLRNPLAIVKNTVEIIRIKPNMTAEEREQHAARFERAVQRMVYQIDDVLNFVKRSELTLHRASVLEMVESAIGGMMIPAGVVITRPVIDAEITCDSRKLEAVFSNLLINAIQAMGGRGEITIRLYDLGPGIRMEFEDAGPGIPDDMIEKIFEPLFTTKQTGTGLGLSICKSIVEQHGGTITVRTRPTVFVINLPRNVQERQAHLKLDNT